MRLAPTVLERPEPQHAPATIVDHYAQQAAWHQQQALVSLGRVQEKPQAWYAPEHRTALLRAALSEALSAWRLLHRAQEEAPTRAAAARVGRHLNRVYQLAERIEQELYEPGEAVAYGRPPPANARAADTVPPCVILH
jgi:hypothetical protein